MNLSLDKSQLQDSLSYLNLVKQDSKDVNDYRNYCEFRCLFNDFQCPL